MDFSTKSLKSNSFKKLMQIKMEKLIGRSFFHTSESPWALKEEKPSTVSLMPWIKAKISKLKYGICVKIFYISVSYFNPEEI
jgi:hypothetical protein